MHLNIRVWGVLYSVIWLFLLGGTCHAVDSLPSWNEGTNKKAILEFVRATTDESSSAFVPQPERIAVFDQDGTLWVEQPLYTQSLFAFERIKELAPAHPEWKQHSPYKEVLSGDHEAISRLTMQDIEKIVAVTHSGMTVEAFHQIIAQWLVRARHPKFKRPYTDLVYQPMLEVLQLLKDHGFTNYIVSGGGQDFIRSYAEGVYQLGPERIIGSAGVVKYEIVDGEPALLKQPKVLLVDDHQGKPETIDLIIGRRPIAAFGNSDGDRQMLEWTKAGEGSRLALLIHHDDAMREYAYGPESKIGTFSDSLMKEAQSKGWQVVSLKDDWKVIFPWQKDSSPR